MSGGGGGAVRAVKSQRRAVAQRCSVPWLGRLVGSQSSASCPISYTGSRTKAATVACSAADTGNRAAAVKTNLHAGLTGEERRTVCEACFLSSWAHCSTAHLHVLCTAKRQWGCCSAERQKLARKEKKEGRGNAFALHFTLNTFTEEYRNTTSSGVNVWSDHLVSCLLGRLPSEPRPRL